MRRYTGDLGPHGCPSHRFDRFEAARARTASLGGCPHHFDTCPTGTPPRPSRRVASMAAQVVVSATDLASQATAPSHVFDEASLLSQPSVIVEAEPEAEPDEPDTFGDFETSDAPYVIPAFQVQSEPINDADRKKWKSYNAQRKKEKKDVVPFEVWLQNKKDQEERKKKAKFVAMMGGAIAASRRGESRHRLVSISLP